MIPLPPTPVGFFKDTAVFKKATRSVSTGGIPSQEWTTDTGITVKCMVQPISTSENIQYGRETGTVLYKMYFGPLDTSGASVGYGLSDFQNMRVYLNGDSSTAYKPVGPALDKITAGVFWSIVLERII